MGDISLYALIIAIILQAADVLTTVKILGAGGKELNKPLAWLMGIIGTVPALIIVKAVLIAFMVKIYTMGGKFAIIFLCAVVIIYACILLWNLKSLKK